MLKFDTEDVIIFNVKKVHTWNEIFVLSGLYCFHGMIDRTSKNDSW